VEKKSWNGIFPFRQLMDFSFTAEKYPDKLIAAISKISAHARSCHKFLNPRVWIMF